MPKKLVLISICFISTLVLGVNNEDKFQQYEQTTIKPYDLSQNLNPVMIYPIRHYGFGWSMFYINPYFDDIKITPVEYKPTTYVSKDEYGFQKLKSSQL